MRAYLSLGANLGDRAATLRAAIAALGRLGRVERVAAFYETVPVGYHDQPDFLNAAVILETDLRPLALLNATQAIEHDFGRIRTFQNAPRTLDIDLIYLDRQVIDQPRLVVPHPRARERAFVLVPLAEIAPDFRDPVTGERIADLVAGRPDLADVRVWTPPT